MKVIEKGTDRTANAHLYMHGRVPPLDEYGEFVNSEDKAIECFVPVEEGQQIKIGGRWSGTTQTIGYDVCIDGICRRSNTYIGKSVSKQSNKKLDADKFLFKTDKGSIVETEILVAKVPSHISPEEHGDRSLGTIELRIYVLRRAGDDHALQDIDPYYAVKEEGFTPSKFEDSDIEMGFTTIPPQYAMTYEKNVTPLDEKTAKRYRTKIDGKRPGAEAWAVFRFHFRSKNSILDEDLKMTFNSKGKEKDAKYRELELEEVPMLAIGEKIKKEGPGRRTPAASTAPSTPAKSGTDEISMPKTPSFKRSTKYSTPTTPTTPTPPAKKTVAKKEPPRSPERFSTPEESEFSAEEGDEDLRTRLFNSPRRKLSLSPRRTMSDSASTTEMAPPAKPNIAPAKVNGTTNGERVVEVTKEIEVTEEADQNSAVEPGKETDTLKGTENSTSNPDQVKDKTNGYTGDNPIKDDIIAQVNVNLASDPETTSGTTSKAIAQKEQKPIPTVEKEPITLSKRPATLTAPGSPKIKRTKLSPEPAYRLPSPALSSNGRGALSPADIAEARKRVAALKAKRQATAKKQSALDEEMNPYQQKLQAELEALNREAEEETRACEEEEQRLKESAAWLEELKGSEMESGI